MQQEHLQKHLELQQNNQQAPTEQPGAPTEQPGAPTENATGAPTETPAAPTEQPAAPTENATAAPSSTGEQTSSSSPTATPSATSAGQPSSNCNPNSATVRRGSTGQEVQNLQNILLKLGYNIGATTLMVTLDLQLKLQLNNSNKLTD